MYQYAQDRKSLLGAVFQIGRPNNQEYNMMLGIKKCSNGNKSKSRDGVSSFCQRILSEEVMFDWRPE